jgi:selenocysteine-specific elongation factor
LPIDRVFTIQGFGTIVTGTLVDGPLEVGQEVELQPGALRARIRGLQRHRTKVQRLEPGTRAAVNLSGLSPDDVARGMVLALPRSLAPASAMDIRLTSTPVMRHALQHDSVVTVLAATAESQARVRLLDADRLDPGAACWAQLVLEAPLAVLPGDRCIVRTPNDTVAGGVVVAVNPRRHRRFHASTLAMLALALDGSPESRLLDRLASGPATLDALAPAIDLSPRELEAAITEAVAAGDAIVDGARVYAGTWLASATGRLAGLAAGYLAEHPLRRVAPREHLRSQARWDSPIFDYVAAAALHSGLLVQDAQGALAPPGYAVQLQPRQREAVERYLAALRAAPFSPPTDLPLDGELLAYLEAEGEVARTRAGVVYAREAMDEMIERTTGWCRDHGEISLAQVRDLFSTSRKYAQAFLEHLDEMRITRRVGDVRVLRAENQPAGD